MECPPDQVANRNAAGIGGQIEPIRVAVYIGLNKLHKPTPNQNGKQDQVEVFGTDKRYRKHTCRIGHKVAGFVIAGHLGKLYRIEAEPRDCGEQEKGEVEGVVGEERVDQFHTAKLVESSLDL